MNLEGRLPIKGVDDTYAMLVRWVNLDIMNGRAKATLESHAASFKRTVRNCQRYGKTSFHPSEGADATQGHHWHGLSCGND